MKKLIIFLIIVAISVVKGVSQQLPVLTLGFENPQFYNPAASAFKNSLNATLQTRQQWVGIPGAPETYIFSVDGKPAENMGIGLLMYNDRTDIIGQLGFTGNYAYKIKINDNHTIGLGLSAQLYHNQVYYDRIKASEPDEDVLLNYPEIGTKFDAGAGLRYAYKDLLYIDFSAINLIRNHFTYEEQQAFKKQQFQLIANYITSVGYVYRLKDGIFKIEPLLTMRSAQGLPLQWEGNISFSYNEVIKVTGGYRQTAGAYAAMQFKLFESISIGYAYDFPNKYLKGITSGSNEIFLSIRLKGNSQTPKDRGSFKDIKNLQKQSQEQYQEIERLQQENERLVKQQAVNDSMMVNQKAEIDHLKSIFTKDRTETDKAKEKYEIKETEIDSLVSSNKNLKTKNFYVIVGSYLTLADAKFFQKILEREGGLQTLVFEREDGKYFFVYSRQVKSQDEANREFKRLKKMKLESFINGNTWIYGEQ